MGVGWGGEGERKTETEAERQTETGGGGARVLHPPSLLPRVLHPPSLLPPDKMRFAPLPCARLMFVSEISYAQSEDRSPSPTVEAACQPSR
jgi:hypothetical protein